MPELRRRVRPGQALAQVSHDQMQDRMVLEASSCGGSRTNNNRERTEMKKLNRRQAWRYIQKRFMKWSPGKSGLIYSGLCFAVRCLNADGKISWLVRRNMTRDVICLGRSMGYAGITEYFWPINCKHGANQRVKAINKILKRKVSK